MFDQFVRPEREATRGVNYEPWVCENGSYTNGYESKGVSKLSGTLIGLVSDVPNLGDTPLYPKTIRAFSQHVDATPQTNFPERLLGVGKNWTTRSKNALNAVKGVVRPY